MKTSNVEPHGLHAAAATRGQRSALLAGAKGMIWRDASTESQGQIRDMTVYGAEFVDNEDGTGQLIIGGSGGGVDPGGGTGGDGTGAASVPIYMLNNSGVNLDQGAVVVVDDTADDAVTRTTTAASTRIVGIVQEPIEAAAIGPVLFNGYAGEVEVTGTVVRGDYLETSTTAGVAQASAARDAGTFGVVTAGADLNLIADSVITEQDTPVTSLAITMPESVTDPDSAGRVLFLALWRDPAVTSNPTITGWTRIGSTSGYWYYQRVCTVGDTATATWTTASPAAAIVALLHPTVASLEDFDYGASATVSGLDGSPHYALAALQGAVAVPAEWTELPSAAIAYDSGGVTDLALSGTVTNDPANTLDWTNPTYANDANQSTWADLASHGSGNTSRLKLDLGSASAVSESWVRSSYPLDLRYSTDDVTYHTPPGLAWSASTTHNGFPSYRRATWTGGDITARYWRIGTYPGSGAGDALWTWELTGTHDVNVEGMLVGQYIGRATSIASPFSDDSAVFVFNLHVEPKPSAILYGPDLGAAESGSSSDPNALLRIQGGQAAIVTVAASGASETLDLSAANHFYVVLTANCTISFSNPPTAGVFSEWGIAFVQGGSGGYTVTWPAEVSWRDTDGTATTTAPTLATAVGAQDTFTLNTQDGGVSYGAALDNGGSGSPATTALDDLSDVTITSVASGDALRYIGGVWVNANLHDEPMIATDGTVMIDGLLNPMMHEVAW